MPKSVSVSFKKIYLFFPWQYYDKIVKYMHVLKTNIGNISRVNSQAY